jgi:hypothetical protein
MSKYDGIMSKVPGGTKLIMEFREGHDALIRILDDPWVTITKFDGNPVPAVQYTWLVWDYEQQRVRLMRKSQNVFEQFVDIVQDWTDEMPMTCDIRVKAEKSGDFVTFNLKPSPQRGTMPPSNQLEYPDIEMYKRGSRTIEQIQAGQLPPILDRNGDPVQKDTSPLLAGAQEVSSLPGEVQATTAPASNTGDVIPTAAEIDQNINLDDIPF